MAASIVLTGLSSNNPVPGTYLQIAFAQGAIAGYQGKRPILLVGNKTTAGSATDDTVVYGPDTTIPCQIEQDVINLFGAGSELHRMWRRVTQWNTVTSVYLIAVAPSAGAAATMTFTLDVGGVLASVAVTGAGLYSTTPTATVSGGGGTGATVSVQTTGTTPNITVTGVTVTAPGSGYTTVPSIVFSGTGTPATATATITAGTPTAAGTVNIWGADLNFQYGFPAAATLASITAGMVPVINSIPYAPFIATQTTVNSTNDSVLLTAKNLGPRGNWLRGQASVVASTGGTSNMTVTNTADAFFAGGTTADSNAAALVTIDPKRFYYLVSAAEDQTQVSAFATQVTAQALPVTGIRQRLFAGSVDTSGNVTTIAQAVNNVRCEFIWSQGSPWTPAELAANAAGLYALYENVGPITKPKINWSGFGTGPNDTWNVPQSRNTTLGPTYSTFYNLLGSGVTPIGWVGTANTYIVKRIVSYCLLGSNPDYRIRDAGKVTICDFFGDDLIALTVANWGGRTFGTEPSPGAPFPDNTTITPNLYRLDVIGLLRQYAQAQMLVQVETVTIPSLVCQQDLANGDRMDVGVQLFSVSPCDQFAILLAQVG